MLGSAFQRKQHTTQGLAPTWLLAGLIGQLVVLVDCPLSESCMTRETDSTSNTRSTIFQNSNQIFPRVWKPPVWAGIALAARLSLPYVPPRPGGRAGPDSESETPGGHLAAARPFFFFFWEAYLPIKTP